jgi:hypothetical protein
MNVMSNDFEYSIEIDETAPRAKQPDKIQMKLKEHQLACLHKALLMEQTGKLHYNLTEDIHINLSDNTRYYNANNHRIINKVQVNTNIGILGDIVGYGKTLTALSLIAASDLNSMHLNEELNVSYCSCRNYSYLSYSTENTNILSPDNFIQSTLIIVPRGPVYIQWLKCLQDNTKLKYLAIDNLNFIKKHLPENKENNWREIMEYFNQFDVVLIKNTTLEVLFSYYYTRSTDGIHYIRRWKRIMIDEAHDISNKIPLMYYQFIWLISGTYENILSLTRAYNNILYHVREAINYNTINLVLVKGKKEFVRNSFKIPPAIEKIYKCKLSAKINAIRNFISADILDKINANDIIGAVRDLGGKSETEDSVIELITKEIKRDLQNKEHEREYIMALDITPEVKALRLKNVENEINIHKNKLQDLTQRLSELNKKLCSICMFEMENPIILECTHSYCGICIVKWMEKKKDCPECRGKIDMNNLIAIKSTDDVNHIIEPLNTSENTILTKEETLLKIIKEKPDGKYLVFSKYDSGFMKLMRTLQDNDINSSELKGNTAHMVNVLERFKTGQIKVILLNTNFAGSGIDISYATDVIIYHDMGIAKHQAIGRAQRVGRNTVLTVHHLYYEHEMPTN